MVKAQEWLTDLIASNRNGFSPTWVPPVISWVVSGGHMPWRAPLLVTPRALPRGTPVPVTVKDTSRRICRKRPPREISVPAGQRMRASQRDQNPAVPSATQSVAGAPLAMVNQNGAPANVAAPRVHPVVPVVRNGPATAPREMSARLRNAAQDGR